MAIVIKEQSLLSSMKARIERFNTNYVVRFREGDVLKLAEPFEGREKSVKGLPVYLEAAFELTRNGRTTKVWCSLGVFLGLPLPKNGFGVEEADDQRMLENNAIFSGFEMRPAEEILETLKKGVRCNKVYASSSSQARRYRWVMV